MADPNTRQGKRTPVTLKIKFKSETLEQFIERYAVDVSQGGIFIRTKEPLAVGTQMRFEFQLRDASPLIGGEGTVVWTRENDPSRPAIAPGMGVRFDRLAEGSQQVLERILSEKAKQAPSRSPQETTKPPLFTDTPTRVAPAPVQDALLGTASGATRDSRNAFNDQHTPLPKPMPFHSDADEFPDEAFEEATKVRALDDLIAQTAEGTADGATGALPSVDELAARRGAASARVDATLSDPQTPPHQVPELAPVPETLDPSSTSPGFASGRASEKLVDRDSAPGLPSPPDVAKQPRLLDTTPSPRNEKPTLDPPGGPPGGPPGADPMERLAKTKLGMEPVPAVPRVSAQTPIPNTPVGRDATTRPSGMAAVPHEATAPTRMPTKKSSAAPILVLLLLLVAAGGAAVWFFVLREKAAETTQTAGSNKPDPGSAGSQDVKTPGSGSDVAVKDGSGSDQAGSAVEPPKGPTVATDIVTSAPRATIEVVGTGQKGPSPLSAKLEKDRAYKARISAPGFATLELDIKGGQDKVTAKLVPKPRVIVVTSEPKGALILLDGAAIGHSTPYEVKLSTAQAAKKVIRVGLIKGGFKPLTRPLAQEAFEEEDARMVATLELKLDVQQQIVRPPPTGSGSGSAGSGSGSGSPPPDTSGSGSTPPPDGAGSGAQTPPSGGGSGGGGGGGAGSQEPTPDFVKPENP